MKKKYAIDAVFALILYGMFTLISLLLVLIGAQIYKGIVRRTDARSDVRASLSYVANKIRSAEEVRLENREGLTVLVLPENQKVETVIYFYDGSLREMLQLQGESFDPSAGEELAAVSGFSLSQQEDDLLVVSTKDADGRDHVLHIQKRTG